MIFQILIAVIGIGALIFVWALFAVFLFDMADYLSERSRGKRTPRPMTSLDELLKEKE